MIRNRGEKTISVLPYFHATSPSMYLKKQWQSLQLLAQSMDA